MVGRRSRDLQAEALVQFLAGALFGLLMWWIDGRQRVSEAEIDSLFRTMAVPAFTTATTPGGRTARRRVRGDAGDKS